MKLTCLDKIQLEQASIFNDASSFNFFFLKKYYYKFYSGNHLPKINDEEYVINLDEFKSIGTHWTAFCVNGFKETNFDRFGVEHIPKEI